MPDHTPHMNIWFWEPGDFEISLSSRMRYGMLKMIIEEIILVDMGILLNNIKFPSNECKGTLWNLATHSDTLRQSYCTPIHDNITKGCHWAFETGVSCQQGTLTPPDNWLRPIRDLSMIYLLRPVFSRIFRDFQTLYIPRYFLNFTSQ